MHASITDKSKGLLGSLTDLAATLVAIAHTRLELLSTDLELEREHIYSMLVITLTTLFCLGIGLVLLSILIVIINWDTHRILSISLLSGFFLVSGIMTSLIARKKANNKSGILSASLAELARDRQQLVTRR